MDNNNQEVEIKIVADGSEVDKEMKKVSKSINKMGKDVEKSADKAEDSFDGLERELKNVSKELRNLSKNINLSGLTKSFDKAMNDITKSVSKAVDSIQKQLQQVLNVKGDIEINAKTTTDIDSGTSSSMMDGLVDTAMSTGMQSAIMEKNLSQMGDSMENTFSNVGDNIGKTMNGVTKNIGDSMSGIGSDIKTTMETTSQAIEESFSKTRDNLKEMFANLNLGEQIEIDMQNSMDSVTQSIKKAIDLESAFDGEEIFSLGSPIDFVTEKIETLEKEIAFFNKEGINLDRISQLQDKLNEFKQAKIVLNLDQPLAELDELFKKFDKAPTRLNASNIIKVFRNIQKELQAVGIDTSDSGIDALFEEWHKVLKTGNKVTGTLKTGMSDLRQQLTLLSNTTRKNINDNLEVARTNRERLQIEKQTKNNVTQQVQQQSKLSKIYKSTCNSIKTLAKDMKTLHSSMKNSGKVLDSTSKKIKKVGDEARKASKSTKSMGTSIKSMIGKLGLAFSVYQVINGLKNSINSFTSSLANSSKMALVFGNETKNMVEWLDGLNSTVTTSKTELVNFSTNLYRMAKNMELSTKDAKDMTKQMTELGADLQAFTGDANSMEALAGALRGEYDSIQNYGYALDDASVKARALAMGLDGASESAKVMARQSLLLEQSGDVLGYASKNAQTLGGQISMLQKNFQALGTAIGSCFGGLLQVVLPVLNTIVVAVTNAFNKLASIINGIFNFFGVEIKNTVGGAVGDINDSLGSGLSDAGGGSGDIADNLSDGAKSAKEIQKSLMGIDEINNLSSPDKDSSGGGGTGGGNGGSGGLGNSLQLGETGTGIADVIEEEFTQLDIFLSKMVAKLKGYWQDFMNGFNTTFDATTITDIKNHLLSIGDSLKDIVTDENVLGAFDMLIRQWSATLGAFVGTVGNLVVQIGEALVGGFDQFLSTDSDYIKGKLVNIFNIEAEAMGEVRKALYGISEIFNGFGSDEAKNAVANILSGFGSLHLELGELASKLGRDFAKILGDSIYDNATEIKTSVEGAFGFIGDVFGTISETLRTSLSGFNKMYDEHIKPFVDSFSQGFSDLVGTLVDGWNTHMQPVLDNIAKKFDEIMSGNVGSAIQSVIDLVGSMIDYFKVLWEDTIQPCVEFVISVFAPTFAMAFETVSIVVLNFIDVVAGILDGVIKVLTGVVDFITGVFSLDLDKALGGLGKIWEGLSKVVSTVWDSIWENSKEIVDNLASYLPKIVKSIKDGVVKYFKELGEKAIDKLEGLWEDVQDVWDDITDVFEDALDGLVKLIPQPIKDIVKLFTGGWKDAEKETDKGLANVNTAVGIGAGAMPKQMADKMSGVIDKASTIWGNVKSGASTAWSGITSTLGSLATSAKDNVKDKLSGVTSNISTIWSNVKSGASTGWSNITSTLSSSVSNAKNQVNTSLSGVTGNVSTIWNNIKSGASTGWSNIKSTLSTSVTNAKNQVGSSLDGAKTLATNVWTGIKSGVSTGWSNIKTAVSGKVNEVKNTVTGMKASLPQPSLSWNSLKTTAQNTINSIKSTITGMKASLPTPSLSWATSIKNSVQTAINNVKKCLNFSWSLPKPKLPKFTPNYTTIAGVKIPTSFSITWHRKGGILPDGSNMIFGMNGNNLMAGGERGTGGEAILPLNRLWDEMTTQFNKQTEQLARMTTNNNQQQSQQPTTIVLQLDGRELARGTVSNMSQLARVGQLNLDFL